MKKKWLAVSLALALMLSACNSETAQENDKVEKTPPQKEVNVQEKEQPSESTGSNGTAEIVEPDIKPGELLKDDILFDAEGNFTVPEAEEAFLKKYPDMKLTKIAIEKEDGIYSYKLEGTNGSEEAELKLAIHTGRLLKDGLEKEDDSDKTFSYQDVLIVNQAYIDAMNQLPGGKWALDGWELDYDDDVLVYEFEFKSTDGQDFEVKLDATTGDLIEVDD